MNIVYTVSGTKGKTYIATPNEVSANSNASYLRARGLTGIVVQKYNEVSGKWRKVC